MTTVEATVTYGDRYRAAEERLDRALLVLDRTRRSCDRTKGEDLARLDTAIDEMEQAFEACFPPAIAVALLGPDTPDP